MIFFYAQTGLDPAAAQRIVDNSLTGGDDGELYLEYVQSEFFAWDDGRLKSSSYDTDRGFGLRAVAGETFGYAHASELSEAALTRAADTVRAVHHGYSGTMDVAPRRTNLHLYSDDNPLLAIPFEDKIALLQNIDAYARGKDSRVKQVSIQLAASWKAVQIIRTGGERRADLRPLVRLSISVYLDNGTRMEDGYHGLGGRYGYEKLFDAGTWKAAVDEAFRQAEVNLSSIAAPAGEMTVVLGNGWPGILLHEAIGHGLEGDFNRKETSLSPVLLASRSPPKALPSSMTVPCRNAAGRSASTTKARRRRKIS